MARKGILWYVFVGSRGGETRMCIVDSLLAEPKNPRQLAIELGMDYSTIRHSLQVLEKNRVIYLPEEKYGAPYLISPEFSGMLGEYEALKQHQTCTKRAKEENLDKPRHRG